MADSDQNGRRITQNMHPNDPRLKHNTTNYESSVTNSRDFVRINGDNYHYRHDWDHKDNSKTGLNNFCHNQTQSASIFSQALAERNSAYTVPNPAGRPLNGNVNQCNQSAPLPPQQVNLAAPLPHSRNMNVPPPPMMTMPQVLLPPPPPPPPPLPAPAPVTSPSNDKPVLPPMFDASRPPPPLPAYIRENGKHKMSTSVEAGPSKIRKPEQSKACSGLCEKCVQRQIRIDIYKQEMEQLLAEDEKRSLAYKKKLQALEKSKQLIKSCYSEELFHFFEEYVEEIPDLFQGDDFLSQFSSTSSMVSSKFSGQILLQLMKLMARNINDSPASLEEALLPALRGAAGARRASPAEPAAAGELLAELAAALAAANPAPPAAPAPTAPAALRPPTFPPPALPPPTYAAPPSGFPPPPPHYFPYPQ